MKSKYKKIIRVIECKVKIFLSPLISLKCDIYFNFIYNVIGKDIFTILSFILFASLINYSTEVRVIILFLLGYR